jgi:SOS response associated peptidase (SRAP)
MPDLPRGELEQYCAWSHRKIPTAGQQTHRRHTPDDEFGSEFVVGRVGSWLMCGRYRRSGTEEVAQFFEVQLTDELRPCYNIAPSQQAPTIRQVGPGRVIAMVRWGLAPF